VSPPASLEYQGPIPLRPVKEKRLINCHNVKTSVADLHHFNADPDQDPSFQIKAQNLENCANSFIFYLQTGPGYLFDSDPDTAFHFNADSDPTFQSDADPCISESATLVKTQPVFSHKP